MLNKKITFFLLFAFISISFAQNKSSYLNPVKLQEQKEFYKLGNVYIGEQPDSSALAWFVAQGVDKVINFRSKKENKKFAKKNYSEEKATRQYGIEYLSIPLGNKAGYNPEYVKTFADAISDTSLTYLIHCKSGTRANYMWIAYLANYKNIPLNDAVEACKKMKINFHFEELLGYPIKIDKLEN